MGYYLLVSNPPHSESLDPAVVTEEFKLSAGEIKIKAKFKAPELWFVEEERLAAVAKARMLKAAGLNCLVAESRDIAAIPDAHLVNNFSFTENGAVFNSLDYRVEFAADADLIIVFCKPIILGAEYKKFKEQQTQRALKKKARRKEDQIEGLANQFGLMGQLSHDAIAASIDDDLPGSKPQMGDPSFVNTVINEQYKNAFLDIYSVSDSGVQRVMAPVKTLRFTGLGGGIKENARDNLEALFETLGNRFEKLSIDRRLVEIPYHEPMIDGKRFSQIVDEVAPELKDIDIFDFASRFCFLANYVKPRVDDLTQVIKVPR